MFADEARFGRMTAATLLASQRNEAADRLPTHLRVRLLVWRRHPEGWNLRLSVHARIRYRFQVFL
jgi:hypothetical protein